jgi:hypothetical protein
MVLDRSQRCLPVNVLEVASISQPWPVSHSPSFPSLASKMVALLALGSFGQGFFLFMPAGAHNGVVTGPLAMLDIPHQSLIIGGHQPANADHHRQDKDQPYKPEAAHCGTVASAPSPLNLSPGQTVSMPGNPARRRLTECITRYGPCRPCRGDFPLSRTTPRTP